ALFLLRKRPETACALVTYKSDCSVSVERVPLHPLIPTMRHMTMVCVDSTVYCVGLDLQGGWKADTLAKGTVCVSLCLETHTWTVLPRIQTPQGEVPRGEVCLDRTRTVVSFSCEGCLAVRFLPPGEDYHQNKTDPLDIWVYDPRSCTWSVCHDQPVCTGRHLDKHIQCGGETLHLYDTPQVIETYSVDSDDSESDLSQYQSWSYWGPYTICMDRVSLDTPPMYTPMGVSVPNATLYPYCTVAIGAKVHIVTDSMDICSVDTMSGHGVYPSGEWGGHWVREKLRGVVALEDGTLLVQMRGHRRGDKVFDLYSVVMDWEGLGHSLDMHSHTDVPAGGESLEGDNPVDECDESAEYSDPTPSDILDMSVEASYSDREDYYDTPLAVWTRIV
ncbi:hypothetical protein KIPB_010465, partial [Kipferlia bialata]